MTLLDLLAGTYIAGGVALVLVLTIGSLRKNYIAPAMDTCPTCSMCDNAAPVYHIDPDLDGVFCDECIEMLQGAATVLQHCGIVSPQTDRPL